MDKLSQRVARDNALDLLTREQLLDYSRLREEEAFLEKAIAELDECRVMLGERSAHASGLIRDATEMLRRAHRYIEDTADLMLTGDKP